MKIIILSLTNKAEGFCLLPKYLSKTVANSEAIIIVRDDSCFFLPTPLLWSFSAVLDKISL